ncbi:hypothetical protein, partial [Streptomyces sp. NPDC096030]|uniref:hypothetical protein n=1 Tax=Streptomyces sp. NPDC096030 TaxID=3155423 RepID=UPI00332504D9
FADHRAYRRAFDAKVRAYVKARYILHEDARVMLRRAELCPPSTYTETYRDHYDAFVSVTPCSEG